MFTDSSEFHSLSQEFFKSLAARQIRLFLKEVIDNSDLRSCLDQSDIMPETISRIASDLNYHFSGDQLVEYVENEIVSKLPSDQVSHRLKWLETRTKPSFSNKSVTHSSLLVDTVHNDEYILDRSQILGGQVLAIRSCKQISSIIDTIRNVLIDSFNCPDLRNLHLTCDSPTLKQRSIQANNSFREDTTVPSLVCDLLQHLGMDPQQVLWEWPSFRIFLPSNLSNVGTYRNGTTSLLKPHRDTWYGSPQHQINFWGPVIELPESQTLRVFPQYHLKTVENTSAGRDSWAHNIGLSLNPSVLQNVDMSNPVAPPLSLGDCMAFAGHSLHASPSSTLSQTRISFEFRILHELDRLSPYTPVNIDYYGTGEIYTNWFNQHGIETNYYSLFLDS